VRWGVQEKRNDEKVSGGERGIQEKGDYSPTKERKGGYLSVTSQSPNKRGNEAKLRSGIAIQRPSASQKGGRYRNVLLLKKETFPTDRST